MSGLTISAIREALRDQIAGNIERDVTVRAYRPVPTGPSIVIDAAAADFVDYWASFTDRGLSTVRFALQINPAGTEHESALRRLDDFLSAGAGNASSVLDAVMADTSLGLTNATTHITGVSVDVETATAVVSVEVHVNKVAQ